MQEGKGIKNSMLESMLLGTGDTEQARGNNRSGAQTRF